jgi:Tol biopolymer transport system component
MNRAGPVVVALVAIAAITTAAPSHGASSVARNGPLFVSTPWPPATDTIRTLGFDGRSPRSLGPGAAAAFSPDGKRIAFVAAMLTTTAGRRSLWVMRADGTHRRLVAVASPVVAVIDDLQWSPDGTRIAADFSTEPGDRGAPGSYAFCGSPSVQVIDAATGAIRRIGSGMAPRWSPDGRSLVFETEEFEWGDKDCILHSSAIVAKSLDGAVTRRLAGVTSNDLEVIDPVWSPRGDLIAFSDARGRLVVVRPNGRGRRVVASGGITSIEWSPDGSRIAGIRFNTRSADDLLVIVRLQPRLRVVRIAPDTAETGYESAGWWSPDGKRLVFTSNIGLCTVNATGADRHCVAAKVPIGEMADWHSRRIAFTQPAPDQQFVLYEINADGSNPHRTTVNGVQPQALPDGRVSYAPGPPTTGQPDRALDPATGATSALPFAFNPPPSWSTVGDRIAVNRLSSLLVGAADGTGLRQIVESIGGETVPVWSPDGTTLAFADPSGRLSTVAADGSSQRALPVTIAGAPAWSADGRSLIFSTFAAPGAAIDAIGADGNGLTPLIVGVFAVAVVVSPDGSWLAYLVTVRTRAGIRWQLWTAAADGESPRQLASGTGYPQGLAWARAAP